VDVEEVEEEVDMRIPPPCWEPSSKNCPKVGGAVQVASGGGKPPHSLKAPGLINPCAYKVIDCFLSTFAFTYMG
jgi:hypothetical protein